MQFEKTNIISSLYGLRAGLSVISEECDRIGRIENEVDSRNGKIKDQIEERNGLVAEKEKKRLQSLNSASEEKGTLVRCIVGFIITVVTCIAFSIGFVAVRNKFADSFNNMAFVCGVFLGVALSVIFILLESWLVEDSLLTAITDCCEALITIIPIIGIICGIVTVSLFVATGVEKHGVAYCGLLFAGIMLSVIFIVINFIRFIYKASRLSYYKNEAREANAEISRLKKEEIEHNTIYAAEKQKLAVWRVQNLRPSLQNINSLYAVLSRVYRPLLDGRDWQHLDLIIFYLETRRAESIKEALQLVDRELQTQRIENLICNATNAIVNTLNSGFSMMQRSLSVVYNGLSEQLRGISGQLSSVNSQLINAQTMNNALLHKANVTSEALVNDMNRIRANSDYMRLKVG